MKQLMLLVLMLSSMYHCIAQAQGAKNTAFEFDYKTKTWSQETPRYKDRYLLLRYKTQPVIRITNLHPDHRTEVNETLYDVIPETKDRDSLKKMDPVRYTVTHTHIMKNADADEVEYAIVVKDKDDQQLYKFTSLAKVYGRWKIDLSTGVIFNIGLHDESYYYEAVGDDQSRLKESEDKSVISPTPALLTHFYRTGKGYFNWGGVFGLGINDSGKTGWYFGGSVLLGDRQRVALSGGMAWRTVKQLKARYQSQVDSGEVVNNTEKVEVDDLLQESYKQGWFVSFSYNLSSAVNKK